MPRLPTADDLGTRIARPTRGVVSIAPDPMGGAIAGVANHIGQIAEEETRKLEELAAQDALNTLERKRLEMTYDPEKGFSNVTGSAVLNRPLLKEVPEAFDTEINNLASSLKTPRAQAYFKQRAANVKNGMTGDLFRHVALQTDKAHEATEQATIDLQADIAAKDPTRLDSALAIAGETAAKAIARLRLDPSKDGAQIAMLTQRAQGRVVMSAIRAMMSAENPDFDGVETLLKQHESIIPGKEFEALKQDVQHKHAEVATGEFARELMADPTVTLSEAVKQAEAKFAKNPAQLKMARQELSYQFELRRTEKAEQEEKLLEPVNTLLGDALRAGRPIGQKESSRVLDPVRGNPEAYAKASKLIDAHNDEVRNERRSAESHARAMAESSNDARMNAINIKYDMLLHPDKYRTADFRTTLFPQVKAGKLKAGDVEELIGMQAKLQDPAKREEFTTLMTSDERLKARLQGSYVNGTKFTALDKEKQTEVLNKARATAEQLLLTRQQGAGQKAGKSDVNDIVDSMFTNRQLRDTFLGVGVGSAKPIDAFDPEGTGGRIIQNDVAKIPQAMRARIEQALRANKQPVTNQVILEYYNAGR